MTRRGVAAVLASALAVGLAAEARPSAESLACSAWPCEDWDFHRECWGPSSERCGWSCPAPVSVLQAPPRDVGGAAGTISSLDRAVSGVRANVSGAPRLAWSGSTFVLVQLRLRSLAEVSDEPGGNESECADEAGWADSSGEGCGAYREREWCSQEGEAGPGWHQAWGRIADYATGGRSALGACCACGGGGEGPATAGGSEAAAPSGCSDAEGWADALGETCAAYTAAQWCTGAGQPGPNWDPAWGPLSAFADDSGRSAADACCTCGGGARSGPLAMKKSAAVAGDAACVDHPEGWVDVLGDACATYEEEHWCTPEGGAGAQWWWDIAKFDDYRRDGHTALTACCACGGGSRAATTSMQATTTPTLLCVDRPEGWVDSDGDSCAKYVQSEYCTPDGQPGQNWAGSVADFGRYTHNRHTALTACCGCGGGATGTIATPTRTWTTTLTTTTTTPCVDSPEGWADSQGDDCAKYVQNRWCTPDGQAGGDFNFSDFATHGHTAATACCGCGGGGCLDSREGWVDNTGDSCQAYVRHQWCTLDGQPGPNFVGLVEDFDRFSVDGLSALDVCCGCGGGGAARRSKAAGMDGPAAELHLVYSAGREELVLVLALAAEAEADLARLLRPGAEVDAAGLAAAAGGLAALRYDGSDTLPPCGEHAVMAHRFAAAGRVAALRLGRPPRLRGASLKWSAPESFAQKRKVIVATP